MDGVGLTRLRWRLRGAWMRPLLVILTLVDAAMVHWLPPFSIERWPLVLGWIYCAVITVVAVGLLTLPLGWAVRRLRPDMPRVVARDYAGAGICVAVTLWLFAAGLANRGTITAYHRAFEDATARAEAYIGMHAPATFIARLDDLDTYAIQAPEIYRTCATNLAGTRDYCVVVDRAKPFGRGVRYAGSEPNNLLTLGTG